MENNNDQLTKTMQELSAAQLELKDATTKLKDVAAENESNKKLLSDAKGKLQKIINVVNDTTPPVPATPSKTTIRYINDTLFASNFGSVLVSLVNFSKDNDAGTLPAPVVLLFALFFLVFRVKAYLDDNGSLIDDEVAVKTAGGVPDSYHKASFIFSLFSWLLYSVSGFFLFTNPSASCVLLIFSLVFFSIWIFASKTTEANKIRHRVFLWTNLVYIICLLALICPVISESGLVYIPYLFLFITLFVDARLSKSLSNLFK